MASFVSLVRAGPVSSMARQTAAAPYSLARSKALPALAASSRLTELTRGLPPSRGKIASSTAGSVVSMESAAPATEATLETMPTRVAASSLAEPATEMSTAAGPLAALSTAKRAAASISPDLTSALNAALPEALERSSITMNDAETASKADASAKTLRGRGAGAAAPVIAPTSAAMCSGLVPQQPPTMPAPSRFAMAAVLDAKPSASSGQLTVPPTERGRPALGIMQMGTLETLASASKAGSSSSGPPEQLRPSASGPNGSMMAAKAAGEAPESIRPRASTVALAMNGSFLPARRLASSSAPMAALHCSVSCTVSMSARSAPPAISPRNCGR